MTALCGRKRGRIARRRPHPVPASRAYLGALRSLRFSMRIGSHQGCTCVKYMMLARGGDGELCTCTPVPLVAGVLYLHASYGQRGTGRHEGTPDSTRKLDFWEAGKLGTMTAPDPNQNHPSPSPPGGRLRTRRSFHPFQDALFISS
jgi:hypothetical protein